MSTLKLLKDVLQRSTGVPPVPGTVRHGRDARATSQRRRVSLLASAALIAAACSAGRAAVTPVLTSTTDGPSVLILTDAYPTDLSIDVAMSQVGSWSLTRGKVVTAPIADIADAVKSVAPTEVVILKSLKSKTDTSEVDARDVDVKPIADALNQLTDEKAERLTVGPSISDLKDVPPGIKVIRLSLVSKTGGEVPAARTRLYRHAVSAVLMANNMTDTDPWTVIKKSPGVITVAMYAGEGSSNSPGITAYPKALGMQPDVKFTYFGTRELTHPGFLNPFDVVVFCGGGGGAQAAAIGGEGADIVRSFVKNGGGYVSSCAGSYLASSGKSYSMHLINSDVLDSKHWARGMGDVDIELTDTGRAILGDYNGLFKCHYANGPLLGPGPDKDLPAYTTLAYFRGDMHKTAPGGVMPGTPAIICAECGKGRVLCFSPHPEYTAGLEGFIDRAVHWVVRQPVTGHGETAAMTHVELTPSK